MYRNYGMGKPVTMTGVIQTSDRWHHFLHLPILFIAIKTPSCLHLHNFV